MPRRRMSRPEPSGRALRKTKVARGKGGRGTILRFYYRQLDWVLPPYTGRVLGEGHIFLLRFVQRFGRVAPSAPDRYPLNKRGRRVGRIAAAAFLPNRRGVVRYRYSRLCRDAVRCLSLPFATFPLRRIAPLRRARRITAAALKPRSVRSSKLPFAPPIDCASVPQSRPLAETPVRPS